MAEAAPAPAAAKAARKKVSMPKGTTLTELIVKVVSAFDERSGVSATALKKALTAGGYDVEKNNSWFKNAIKSLVTKGTLVQIKGIGAGGSFRMSKTAPKANKPAAKKPAAAKNTKTAAVNKPAAAAESPKKAKKPAVDKKTTLSELIVKVVSASDERMSAPSVIKALAARGYDVEKKKTRVKTAIKSLVTKRILIQTKGTGASGSFKMNKTPPKAKKPAAKKPAKKSPKKAKKPAKDKKTTLSELIVKVVSASDERSGVSAPSVMKALAARGYDVEKKKTRIKTAIKRLVTKGTLIQTKGTGASGSFKMNKTAPKAKKPAAKKPTAAKKTKTVAVKKPAAAAKKSPKKAKKPAAAKKTMTAAVKKHVCVMQPMGDGLSFSCMTDCR
ncbi:uncharacterized protein PEZ65_010019 [Lycodopsis pacificus]